MIEGINDPIQGAARAHAPKTTPHRSQAVEGTPSGEKADALELSETARDQLASSNSSEVRKELVERVRQEIEAGTYLTDEKLDFVAERLRRILLNVA